MHAQLSFWVEKTLGEPGSSEVKRRMVFCSASAVICLTLAQLFLLQAVQDKSRLYVASLVFGAYGIVVLGLLLAMAWREWRQKSKR